MLFLNITGGLMKDSRNAADYSKHLILVRQNVILPIE